MNSQRIGIIGSGSMAVERIRAFQQRLGNVVGFVGRESERTRDLARSMDIRHYPTQQSLLADVDAIVVCLPNHLHAASATDALVYGKHVLVEYPLCCTPGELSELQSAASRAE